MFAINRTNPAVPSLRRNNYDRRGFTLLVLAASCCGSDCERRVSWHELRTSHANKFHGIGQQASASLQPIKMQEQDYFDTCHLLKLRAVVQHAASYDLVSPKCAEACRTAQARYSSLVWRPDCDGIGQQSDADAVYALFGNVWAEMNLLPLDHPLYVPPIYEGLGNKKLLLHLIMALRTREASEDTFQSGQFIVEGFEGTGKTTIMKAVAIAVAVCSTKFLLVYVDASSKVPAQNLTPAYIMTELTARYTAEANRQLASRLAVPRHQGQPILIHLPQQPPQRAARRQLPRHHQHPRNAHLLRRLLRVRQLQKASAPILRAGLGCCTPPTRAAGSSSSWLDSGSMGAPAACTNYSVFVWASLLTRYKQRSSKGRRGTILVCICSMFFTSTPETKRVRCW